MTTDPIDWLWFVVLACVAVICLCVVLIVVGATLEMIGVTS